MQGVYDKNPIVVTPYKRKAQCGVTTMGFLSYTITNRI
jgi:hypothetical protein